MILIKFAFQLAKPEQNIGRQCRQLCDKTFCVVEEVCSRSLLSVGIIVV